MNMKRVIALSLVIGCGIFGYTAFLNTPIAGAEERDIANLEAQFAAANQSFMNASRSGAAAMDMAMAMEAARAKMRRVQSQLQDVKPRLKSEDSLQRAQRLEEKIRAFLQTAQQA
jgi:hypothetical protein